MMIIRDQCVVMIGFLSQEIKMLIGLILIFGYAVASHHLYVLQSGEQRVCLTRPTDFVYQTMTGSIYYKTNLTEYTLFVQDPTGLRGLCNQTSCPNPIRVQAKTVVVIPVFTPGCYRVQITPYHPVYLAMIYQVLILMGISSAMISMTINLVTLMMANRCLWNRQIANELLYGLIGMGLITIIMLSIMSNTVAMIVAVTLTVNIF